MKGYFWAAVAFGVGYYLGTRGTLAPVIESVRSAAAAGMRPVTDSEGAFESETQSRAEEGPAP